MEMRDFILDMLDRVQKELTNAVAGLTHAELKWRPGPETNSIGFVLWHQLRCEDVTVNGWIQREPQLWVSEQWCRKLDLPDDPGDDGYGYTAEQVEAFPVPPLEDLLGYGAAVRARTGQYLKSLGCDELDRVVHIEPVSEDVKVSQLLSSLLAEIALHVGQIAYLRGLQRGINA
jgi:hypothetical protein